jgi:fatty acid desaturase
VRPQNQKFLRRLALFLLAVIVAVASGVLVGVFGWARWDVVAIVLLFALIGAYQLMMPEIVN